MSNFYRETVTHVHHWTDSLFSFRTTRDQSFRFDSGQFIMMGLEIEGKPLLRAYSLASAAYADELEFFSIKVPDGPLTSRLQHLREGDTVLVGRKATGTLVHQNLLPGKRLYLLGTGTGLAPFLSVIKDPETYARYEKVILVHGCRHVAELAYGEMITSDLPNDELVGALVKSQLIYYPTVTREPFVNRGRRLLHQTRFRRRQRFESGPLRNRKGVCRLLEHDPEKCEAVFGKDHAQSNR
jgi:ferredoxin--NADP+ reductase